MQYNAELKSWNKECVGYVSCENQQCNIGSAITMTVKIAKFWENLGCHRSAIRVSFQLISNEAI
jgi:hypothetical protein